MAEPDPRDYVLVPVEDLYEDTDPMYRSAAHYEQVNLHVGKVASTDLCLTPIWCQASLL